MELTCLMFIYYHLLFSPQNISFTAIIGMIMSQTFKRVWVNAINRNMKDKLEIHEKKSKQYLEMCQQNTGYFFNFYSYYIVFVLKQICNTALKCKPLKNTSMIYNKWLKKYSSVQRWQATIEYDTHKKKIIKGCFIALICRSLKMLHLCVKPRSYLGEYFSNFSCKSG